MQRWRVRVTAVVALWMAAIVPVAAQVFENQDSQEPPMIAGRVALAEGDAQVWRVEENASGVWDAAQINDVVTVATGLHTGADGRMELRIGPHTFRLAAGSRGGFSQLDYGGKVFNLEHGTLNARLGAPEHGESIALTLPGLRVDLTAPGRYRVETGPAGPVRVTTFDGYAVVRGGTGSITVGAGQALTSQPELVDARLEQAVQTAFDQWALARDDRYREITATRHVSPYMTGHEELDLHGDWIADSTYGTVWTPRVVPAGWAPYRNGQWRWVRPWGWTWVDHAPWGYAPFHYGRWVTIGNRWCWWPGGYVRRPVWAPALVGFVGGGSINVSIGIGGPAPVVGWYPLAPWHRYRPHYRSNPTYITVINQTVINAPPRGVPRDINRHRGGTMVPGPRFREPVTRVALHERSKFAQLQPINTPPPPAGWRRGEDRREQRGEDRRDGRGEDRREWRGEDRREWRGEDRRDGRGQDSRWQRGEDRGDRGDRGAQRGPTGPNRTAPVGEASRPTRIAPPLTADPVPGRGVTPPPPLPGNEPRLLPSPQMRAVPGPRQQVPTPQLRPAPEVRPLPRPHLPADQLAPGPRQRFTDPAEPVRTPPGAPPTIRQPTRAMPTDRIAPPQGHVPRPQLQRPAPTAVAPTVPVAPQVAPPPAMPAARVAPAPRPEARQREARPSPGHSVLREARESGGFGRGPQRTQPR